MSETIVFRGMRTGKAFTMKMAEESRLHGMQTCLTIVEGMVETAAKNCVPHESTHNAFHRGMVVVKDELQKTMEAYSLELARRYGKLVVIDNQAVTLVAYDYMDRRWIELDNSICEKILEEHRNQNQTEQS